MAPASVKTAADKAVSGLSSGQRSKLLAILKGGKKEELLKLPGVGEATVTKLQSAARAGAFKSPADLVNITGFGERKFKDIIKFGKTL